MDDACDRSLKVSESCNIAAGVIHLSGREDENYIHGSILSSPTLSWVSCGPRLTTLNNNDGSKRTGWTFGWALSEPSYKVVCVEELNPNSSTSPILAVACDSEASGSSLCFYHSGSSRVLKAVQFTEKITAIAVVSKANYGEERISRLLKVWNGIVAVGTSSGNVYLLDVWWDGLQKCIEDCRHRHYDEQKQSKVVQVTMKNLIDNVDCKSSSVRHGSSTLALWLNEETLQRGSCGSHPGVQNILGRMPREYLTVTALKYFPQIGTLAVGYNTSCFQLWDLTSLRILFTSALLEAMLPVFTFSLLEPSDDPRFVCYLWSLHHSDDEDTIPFAGMYILNYNEKLSNRYNSLSYYKGFSSCSIRFQLDLGVEIDNVISGRIISCQSIVRSNPKTSSVWLFTDQEDNSSEEISPDLLAVTWEVWTHNQLRTYQRLTLFDLNQWYRECMPQSSDTEYSHFMTHFCLPEGPTLDVKVIAHSVRQFVNLQPVDEHFYPSAMSFKCVCLHHSHILTCQHVSLQEECLHAVKEAGPSGLLLPARLYKMCSQAGIKPLLVDIGSPSTPQSKEQREYLLSIALEYRMTQFLRNCVRDWSDGSHAVAGCTLPSLLHWAWGRVEKYKKWLDRLCVPLFDCSGTALDNNDLGIFHHMICQLHSLHDLFILVLEKYRNCIIQGNYEQQRMAINLVTAYYDSMLWCIRNKVLPETGEGDVRSIDFIPYFTEKIISSTVSRRTELHHLAKSLKHPVPASGLLLIDAVISVEAGGTKLTDQWEREGGIVTLGRYPPPSVQSLLRTYLVRDIPAHIKHFIVTYFLHDIVYQLNYLNQHTKEKLLKYPMDFGLTVSHCKIIQAFWCLDHKEYEEGVGLLLDGCINKEDLQVYHHRTIICLLVGAAKHKLALHYLNICRPGLVEEQDIKMKMTLLLINNLFHEAFQFQRHHQIYKTDLLRQFFEGCVEANKLDIVFKLPLNSTEEQAFMTFLEKTSHPQADDLRVLYLLSRSRYIEAIDVNEKLRSVAGSKRGSAGLPLGYSPLGSRTRNLFGPKDLETGAPARAVLTTRDLIINSVAKSLPSVTRELAAYCSKEKTFSWKQVNRPTPLSVVVHTELSNERLPFYKAGDLDLVQAALSKTRETWAPLLVTPAALKRKLCSAVEDTPFLRTPVMPRFNYSESRKLPEHELTSGIRPRTDDDTPIASKRARVELSASFEREKTRRDETLNKTVDMDVTCPESLALLHTPHVAKVVKVQIKETATPQSILKSKSNATTPCTPLKGEKATNSSVNRQIRFSLPKKSSSPCPTMEVEENDNPTPVSPRKSIHGTSSLQNRKGTPGNPRISRMNFRNVMTKLQFDDDTTAINNDEYPVPIDSSLNKGSTTPESSEDAYLSFQSNSSSRDSRSQGSRSSFKLPLGLEENTTIGQEFGVDNQLEDELEITDKEGDEIIKTVPQHSSPEKVHHNIGEFTPNSNKDDFDLLNLPTLQQKMEEPVSVLKEQSRKMGIVNEVSLISNESLKLDIKEYSHDKLHPKNTDERKIVVEGTGNSTFPRTPIKTMDLSSLSTSSSGADSSLEDEEESDANSDNNDFPLRKHIWTEDLQNKNQKVMFLQEKDRNGKDKCLAKVALTEEMPMLYLEPKNNIVDQSKPSVRSDVDVKKPCDNIKLNSNETLNQVQNAAANFNQSTHDTNSKDITSDISYSNSDLNKTPVSSSICLEKSYSGTNFLDSRADSNDHKPSEIKTTGYQEPGQLEKHDKTRSIKSDINLGNSTSNQSILINLDEVVKRGRISKFVSPSSETIANISNIPKADIYNVENQTGKNVHITTSEDKKFHQNLPVQSSEVINKKIIPLRKSKDFSVPKNYSSAYVNISDNNCQNATDETSDISVSSAVNLQENESEFGGVTERQHSFRDSGIDATNQLNVESSSHCQNLQEKSNEESENKEILNNTIVIESVGTLINDSNGVFIKEFESDSVADFELKMSEDESVLGTSTYSQAEKVEQCLEQVSETLPLVQHEQVVSVLEVEKLPNLEILKPVDEGYAVELSVGSNKESNEITQENDPECNNLVFETLKPVPFNENVNDFEEFDEQIEEDTCVEEEDVDVCGDLEEPLVYNKSKENKESYSAARSERDYDDTSSDIIMLDSSSNESAPQNPLKESTPYKRRSVASKEKSRTREDDEILDYEEDGGYNDEEDYSYQDDDDDDDDDGDDVYDDDDDDDEDDDDTNLQDSSSGNEVENDSESELESNHHGNRSWKEQRVATNESKYNISVEDENTIESPPYELIGENSKSEDITVSQVTSEIEKNKSKEASTTKTLVDTLKPSESEEKCAGDITTDQSSEITSSEVKLEIETAQAENMNDNVESVVDEKASQISPAISEKVISDNIETDTLKSKSTEVINLKSYEETDLVKLAVSKRKKCLETGSILDLKNRRSKRYSSVENLSPHKKLRNRRRSSSFHDLTSLIIKETKSQQSLALDQDRVKIVSTDCSNVISSTCSMEEASHVPAVDKSPSESFEGFHKQVNQPGDTSATSESLYTTSNDNSEVGSVPIDNVSLSDMCSLPKEYLNEIYKKKLVRPVAARLSSLQDISEESSENVESSRNITNQDSMLRRSLSASQLQEKVNFVRKVPRRSSSVCNWLEYSKTNDEEFASKIDSQNASLHQTDDSKTYRNSDKLLSEDIKEIKESRKNNTQGNSELFNSGFVDEEKSQIISEKRDSSSYTLDSADPVSERQKRDSADCFSKIEDFDRSKRAQSEPLGTEQPIITRKSVRRSSSLIKIEEVHKKIFSRSSIKNKRSLRDSNFEPLELLLSDEETCDEPSTNEYNQQKSKQLPLNCNDQISCNSYNFNDSSCTSNQRMSTTADENQKTSLDPVEECQGRSIPDCSTFQRQQRGQSEPPTINTNEELRPKLRRRSSSSLKLNHIHKLLLPRYSLRKCVPGNHFKPLEIVSDDLIEESDVSVTQNNKKGIDQDLGKLNSIKGNELTEGASQISSDVDEPAVKKSNRTKPAKSKTKVVKKNLEQSKNDGEQIDDSNSVKNIKPSRFSRKKGSKTVSGHEDKHLDLNTDGKTVEIEKKSKSPNSKRKGKSSKTLLSDDSKIEVGEKEETMSEKDEEIISKKRKVSKQSVAKPSQSKKNIKQLEEPKEIPEKAASSFSPISLEDNNLSLVDSPARRTRRSLSRASDTELLTPLQDQALKRRTRRSSAMSDIVLSTPTKHEYAESEVSDTSTSSRLNTPTRRSMRIKSTTTLPSTPELVPEEYLVNRRLTRTQQSQLQKSFESSLINSPKSSKLQDVPEESAENEIDETTSTPTSSTPKRPMSRKTPSSRKPRSKNK